jgi:choline-sulfatase
MLKSLLRYFYGRATMNKRPNILFLMSDEHRPDIAGFAGDPVVRTPTLDWLAKTGVTFTNAYTPSPICVPARQCMASGKLPKTCNCEGWIDLKPGYMTFARRFSQYAYNTVCCGKLHHLGPDMMQGWTHRPAGIGDLELATSAIEGRIEAEFKRYERPFSDFKWDDIKEVKRAGIGRSYGCVKDEQATATACDFIDEYFTSPTHDREKLHQPLMLKVSLIQPHYPYQTSEEKFGYYINRVKPFTNQQVFDHPFLSQRQVHIGNDVNEREARRATATYYGMIQTIDEHYAQVIERLKYVGENLDDWIIVYVSDHGELLGEHGIWEKQKFFEASVRVPMIIRWPKGFSTECAGKVVDQNVNLCDLFATLCDLAGLEVPDGLDSRSLVPLIKGDASNWSNETISQFGTHNVMIKQDALKYQYYGSNGPEVLFDLARDPAEMTNFIDDPQYADALVKFRKRLATLGHGPNADVNYVNAGYCN